MFFCYSEVNTDYKEVLQQLVNKVTDDADQPNTMVISRSKLLATAVAAVKRPRFSLDRLIHVTFAGEDAEDYGGPRREFLW